MFDFGNANDGQRKAISAAEGPVLITAGPGTGKTYTLVQRAIYLITLIQGKHPSMLFIRHKDNYCYFLLLHLMIKAICMKTEHIASHLYSCISSFSLA